ncbi:NEAT domain-containing protein [Paenibacillus thailandensis]|uniref:NEAT domain-containing protein n=1 Tax=Paenibacillus thailandensis TaxID=393250 RepID=A0ABW5QVX1_9BACL
MQFGLRKSVAFGLIVALLVSLLQVGTAAAATEITNETIPNGEYAVDFRILKDNDPFTDSTATQYMKIPSSKGKLIVQDGEIWFEHEIEASQWNYFEYLGYRPEGAAKTVISGEEVQGLDQYEQVTVSDSSVESRKILRYGIADITSLQDIVMHINIKDIPGFVYDHWYNAQLSIDTSGIEVPDEGEEPGEGGGSSVTLEQVEELISVAQAVYDSSVEGTGYGQYEEGSKIILHDAIEAAREALSLTSEGDESAYEAIYNELYEQLEQFKGKQKLADLSRLRELVAEVQSFVDSVDIAGTANGNPGGTTVAIVAGEYDASTINRIKNNLVTANKYFSDPATTDTQVNTLYNRINGDYSAIENKKYVANEPLGIYVLDTRGETATESVYAHELSDTVDTISRQEYYDSFEGLLANLKLNVKPDNDIVYWFNSNGDTYYNYDDYKSSEMLLNTIKRSPNKAAGDNVYQGPIASGINSESYKDTVWTGLGSIRYEVNGEARTLYISFNRFIHERLKSSLAEAVAVSETEKPENIEQETYDRLKADLLDAIDEAREVTGNLNAARPTILAAQEQLETAVEQFEEILPRQELYYYSAAHATDSAFSSVDSYLAKPAKVMTVSGGEHKVTLTINDSATITGLQVEQNSVFEDVYVVNEDTAANKRIVSFTVPDLSEMINAKISVSAPYQGTTYKNTYDIRLNFNGVDNTELSAAYFSAAALLKSAVTGTGVGQYPEAAKAAFASAVAEAGKAAVNGPGTEEETAAALAALRQAEDLFKKAVITENPGTGENPDTGGNPGTGTPGEDDEIADGYYYIDFKILKDGTNQTSIANDYVVSPALLKVTDGKYNASFTVLRSKEVTSISIDGSSGKVVSRDNANNTRVMSYSIPSLSKKIDAKVKVDWDEINYHHTYDIQFLFDEDSLEVADVDSEVIGGDGNVGPPDLELPEEDAEVEGGTATGGETAQGGTSAGGSVSFTDTEGHWAADYISRGVQLGIVNGYADGSFLPNGTINRGEFITMISRALKLSDSQAGSNATSFKDADRIPAWASQHAVLAVDAGLISGYEDGAFRPGNPITRAELAVIVTRAAKLDTANAPQTAFADEADIPAWASKEVAAAVEAGLITGKDGGRFDPNAPATRAEALAMVIRLVDLIAAEEAEAAATEEAAAAA